MAKGDKVSLGDTVKTSAVLVSLEAQMESVKQVSDTILIWLEDDARIEDLQAMYKEPVQDMLGKVIIQEYNARLTAHPMVLEKCRKLVDMVEGLYRLVK